MQSGRRDGMLESAMEPQDPPVRLHLYGRSKGPALRSHQAGLVATLLPRLRVPPESAALDDPRSLFEFPARDVWLEIGFGGGEHLAFQAREHPEVGFLGCERFLNGIAKLLVSVETDGLTNIRIHDGDARDLVSRLAAQSIGCAFLLFPDPWPKRRHRKRRFMNRESLCELHRVLRPGGYFCFASDSADYVEHTLAAIEGHGGFSPPVEPPFDWPPTRYEAKARAAGREPRRLAFMRLP